MPTPMDKIEAISVKCLDESGPNWPGSDEPYFVWTSTNEENRSRLETVRSETLGDVDAGESRTFSRPVFLVADAGVTGGIALNTVVMENDQGKPAKVAGAIAEVLKSIRWGTEVFQDPAAVDTEIDEVVKQVLRGNIEDKALEVVLKRLGLANLASLRDDVLAVRSVIWWVHDLNHLTHTGASSEEAVNYDSSQARYRVLYRVTRLSDRRDAVDPGRPVAETVAGRP